MQGETGAYYGLTLVCSDNVQVRAGECLTCRPAAVVFAHPSPPAFLTITDPTRPLPLPPRVLCPPLAVRRLQVSVSAPGGAPTNSLLSVDGFSGIYGNFGVFLDSLNSIGGTGPTAFSFTCPYGLIIGIEVWALCMWWGAGMWVCAERISGRVVARCKLWLCLLSWLLQLELQPSGIFAFISGIRFLCNLPNNC